ncbi:MAG: lytic murein transglycosylase [Candidatus Wildermuthbacteria bacterium]|nr:lytic murein transglycosylase [Candidatus Wildermuthbacteria bacterium]
MMKSLVKKCVVLCALIVLAGAYGARNAVFGATPAEERAQLEQELRALENEIGKIEGDITKTQKEKQTLQNQLSLLQSKIKKLDLQIAQSNAIIGDLRSQIADTALSVEKTNQEIASKKEQLGGLLLRLYREDKKGIAEVMLTGSSLSGFFGNLAALEALQGRNRELLETTIELSGYLQEQRAKLEGEKGEEENFVKIQILQKYESQGLTAQNQKLLETTKGKETEYQKLLADKKKAASGIRSRIFELTGVADAPTFGEASEIAKAAGALTGVRPAFLLAVLTQESNIGKNVGQCYLKNPATGSGARLNGAAIASVMKPSRDVQPFLQITRELGRDPYNTAVSCPIASVGGYGGAMGPAQFIPSTWVAYKDKIAQLKGGAGDPWNIRDAFLAAAVYLRDAKATRQTHDYEWCAAVTYFSGNCSVANQRKYEFYGDSVMAIAARYEADIKALED